MEVIVSDRQQGKTTKLFKWVLGGHLQRPYPQWSRVIVCCAPGAVPHTTRHLAKFIWDTNFDLCGASLMHEVDTCTPAHRNTFTQITKNVWSLRDFQAQMRGREFEYAVDDIDYLLSETFRSPNGPAVITLTGKTHDPLGK